MALTVPVAAGEAVGSSWVGLAFASSPPPSPAHAPAELIARAAAPAKSRGRPQDEADPRPDHRSPVRPSDEVEVRRSQAAGGDAVQQDAVGAVRNARSLRGAADGELAHAGEPAHARHVQHILAPGEVGDRVATPMAGEVERVVARATGQRVVVRPNKGVPRYCAMAQRGVAQRVVPDFAGQVGVSCATAQRLVRSIFNGCPRRDTLRATGPQGAVRYE
jgi:hypothetical protein